jgi:excisionase family DNA binding protein
MTKTEAQYLSPTDAGNRYGLSGWTIRRWAYSGKIGSVKLGKRLLIPVKELERLVSENTRPRLEG